MERTEALPLLNRICTHWGMRLANDPWDHWIDTLLPLDAGQAGTTLARMMRSTDKPSPASFLAAYGQLRTRSAEEVIVCELCANTGLVTCHEHPRHRGHWQGREKERPVLITADGPDPSVCLCNIARPCSCKVGRTDGVQIIDSAQGPRRRTDVAA